MAKWFGNIGYAETIEVKKGQWQEVPTTHQYYGDLIRNTRRLQTVDKVNDNITVANELSIVADTFANENFYCMRWAEVNGIKWKVDRVDVAYPRLNLTLGEVYNE